jgi:hypothetical protein
LHEHNAIEREEFSMSVCLRTRRDITLEAVHAVAWQGESVVLAPEAL